MTPKISFDDHPLVAEINEGKMWMTQAIRPINERLLEVEIASSTTGAQTTTVAGFKDVRPIFIGADSKAVRFEFLDFVSYAVTEEMYLGRSSDDPQTSGWVSRLETSYFLEFVIRSTWATAEYPGPLAHYQINTLDHRIDVVTPNTPEITGIKAVARN